MNGQRDNQLLRTDPARQATASLSGYASQIWRSVLIWLRLGEGERLYLEGAEDIDVIHGPAAETIQVKVTKGNITLRSADIVEAINNAWLNQQRNRDRAIRYRLLTNASIGMEQGDPIGLGIPGLVLWERARSAIDEPARLADTHRIRQFLLNEGRVSAAVQAFLREADGATIWDRLISRVEWDTDAAEAPEVVQEIEDDLVVLGQSRGISIDEAEKVAAHLYEAAWAVATTRERDRLLVRADALRIFDEKTRMSVPQAAYSMLLASLAQVLGSSDSGALVPLPVVGRSSSIGRTPSVQVRHYARPAVVREIETRLGESRRIVLYGATGTGKSTLAAEYIAAATAAWGWVDLRGMDHVGLSQRLDSVVADLESEDGINNVVLDDLELPADPRGIETPLAEISHIIDGRGGKLIITSNTIMPQRIALALALQPRGSYNMPPFSRADIAQFLAQRGCPGETLINQWAALIELHTSGHPQLVHARIAALEALDFPVPGFEDITATPPDIIEARTEARRLLALLDAPARELVYRLSLTTSIFQRKHVLSIASQDPTIAEPGLAFDKVVGPWMERIGDDLYRISPLIRNAGSEVQGEAWAQQAHNAIGWGLLAVRTLTPYDVSGILFHGIASRNWSVIAYLCRGILNADSDTWAALAEAASWFVLVGVGEGVAPLNADPFSLLLIRTLQYRLAAVGKNFDAARRVLVAFNSKLPPGQGDEALRLARQYFLGQVLWRSEVPLPITEIISMGNEYLSLTDDLSHILGPEFQRLPHHALQGPNGAFDAASVVGFTLSNRINDRPAIAEMLDACEPLPKTGVRRLLWFIGGTEAVASLMFSRAILWEGQQPKPDWAALRDLALRAFCKAREWELPGLAQAAAYRAAQIIDEHLDGRDEALRVADQLAREIGWSAAQEDGLAAIYLRNGQFSNALEIWRRILPSWQPQSEFDLQAQFSCRDAAIAAARLAEWGEAGDWLADARERTGKGANPVYEAALLIDEGYARWKVGDLPAALLRLANGLAAIEQLAPDETDERAYALRKRAGHTIMWVATVTDGASTGAFSEPPPGFCSSLNPVSGAKDLSTPHDIMWAHLVAFELSADLGSRFFREHEERLVGSPFGVVRVNFGFTRFKRRLKDLSLNDLVEVAVMLAEATETCRHYYGEGEFGWGAPLPVNATIPATRQLSADLVLSVLLSGLFALAARGAVTGELIERWRGAGSQLGLAPAVTDWFDLVNSLFVTNAIDAQVKMYEKSLRWEGQVIATLRVATDDASRPSELLTAHVCWANTLGNLGLSFCPIDDIERLVTSGWLRLSTRPFLLRTPALSVPELKRACASGAHGWRKVGEILSAGLQAVPAAVPESVRETVRRLVSA